MRQSAADFLGRSGVIQVHVHGVHGKQGVQYVPLPGLTAEYKILERLRPERAQARVDAFRVGLHQGPVRIRCRSKHDLCTRAEAVESITLVSVERRSADQFGQLTGCLPANQVHLEKAVLAVGIASRIGEILATRCRYNRDALGIALDRDVVVDAPNGNLAIQLWKTCPQAEPGYEQENGDQRNSAAEQPLEHSSGHSPVTSRILRAFVLPVTPSRSPLVRIARSPALAWPSAISFLKIS